MRALRFHLSGRAILPISGVTSLERTESQPLAAPENVPFSGFGRVKPPPGIPDGDIQYGAYDWWFSDAWNLTRTANMYPIRADIPVFYRYIDAWNATNETSIYDSAALAACALPFVR